MCVNVICRSRPENGERRSVLRKEADVGHGFKVTAKTLLIGALSLHLVGCATVKLVSEYDEQIDTGTTQVYADVTTFVDKMTEEAGTKAGTYDQNKDFYATEDGKIKSLLARAEAEKGSGACPGTAQVAMAASRFVKNQNVLAQVSAAAPDDCLVTELTLISENLHSMQLAHQAFKQAGLPPDTKDKILSGGIGPLARTIILVESKLKAGTTGTKANGS
jgi:hypothetical protein